VSGRTSRPTERAQLLSLGAAALALVVALAILGRSITFDTRFFEPRELDGMHAWLWRATGIALLVVVLALSILLTRMLRATMGVGAAVMVAGVAMLGLLLFALSYEDDPDAAYAVFGTISIFVAAFGAVAFVVGAVSAALEGSRAESKED